MCVDCGVKPFWIRKRQLCKPCYMRAWKRGFDASPWRFEVHGAVKAFSGRGYRPLVWGPCEVCGAAALNKHHESNNRNGYQSVTVRDRLLCDEHHRDTTGKPTRWNKKARAWYLEYKSRPCADCGVKYPPFVMDLDHMQPELKTGSPSMIVRFISCKDDYDAMVAELTTCEVVCSNCHRYRTVGRRNPLVRGAA